MRITFMPGAPLPSTELVTSAHGFCFHEGKVMLVNLNHRGGDIPGGHREGDESPAEAFAREAREEGYVEGRCTYIGCCEISHMENPAWQPGSKYPLVGYQVFYRMDIERILPFDAAFEASHRLFLDPADVPRHHHNWQPILDHVLAAAQAAAGENAR
ncbi:MAG: NUDIX domain-containing protein [Bacillota bacterium]